jgi:hypothetical protein
MTDNATYIVENGDEVSAVIHRLRAGGFDATRDRDQLERIAAAMRVIHRESRVIRYRDADKVRRDMVRKIISK